jgi:hypothetical protein
VPLELADSGEYYDPATYVQTVDWDLKVPQDEMLDVYDLRTYTNFVMYLPAGYVCPADAEFTIVFESDTVWRQYDFAYAVRVGGLFTGFFVPVGTTLYNTTIGITDYSRKERDAFGRAEIKGRGYTNRVNFKVAIDTKKIYAVKDFLASVRADLCIYMAHPDLQGTVVAGYFKDFSIPYDSYTESIFNLEVEGL